MKQIPLNYEQYALVDDEDYDKVKNYVWNTQPICYSGVIYGYGYVRAMINKKVVPMHVFLFGKAPKGFVNDHKNRNKLDNRRENIRHATYSQNSANSIYIAALRGNRKYKGVGATTTGFYNAAIMCNGIMYKLGRFSTANEAAQAYNEKALELFGEFAVLNEIK